jgi:hypothetical protein
LEKKEDERESGKVKEGIGDRRMGRGREEEKKKEVGAREKCKPKYSGQESHFLSSIETCPEIEIS